MELLELLDELRVIGQNGLRYADDPYDEERYARILELVSQSYGETLGLPPGEVRDRLGEELGHVTPKVGAEAAIFDSEGDILLMLRSDTGDWCLPCGWTEPRESPEQTAVRETREETGLEVVPRELVDVYAAPPSDRFGPHGRISLVYLCEVESGELALSREGDQLAYREIAEVADWHKRHETFARDAQRVRLETE